MRIVTSPAAMQRQARAWRGGRVIVGLVPTMGALHEGHLALIRRARLECGLLAVSIYVNPTQFGPKEDLARYPRPRTADLASCRGAGVDLVFAPANLYLPDHSTFVEEGAVSQGRDGASRPGHFRGVATVVLKLFKPRAAGPRLLRAEGRATGRRHPAHGARSRRAGAGRGLPDRAGEGRRGAELAQCLFVRRGTRDGRDVCPPPSRRRLARALAPRQG